MLLFTPCFVLFAFSFIEIISIKFFKDVRHNGMIKISEPQPSSRSFLQDKQSLVDWLIEVEKTLRSDEFQITFLSILEEKFKIFKVI